MVILNPSDLRHVVAVSLPAVAVPDDDGGYTQTPAPHPTLPTWRCKIESAGGGSAVRHFSETVVAQATYMFTGRFHPGVSAQAGTILQWTDKAGAHTGKVIDDDDVESAGVTTLALVVES